MREVKFKGSIGIGLAGCRREFEFTITENECNIDDPQELEEYAEQCANDELMDVLDFGWQQVDE